MYDCPVCQRGFTTFQGLNNHLRDSIRHAGCGTCHAGFTSTDDLHQHFRLAQNSPDAYNASTGATLEIRSPAPSIFVKSNESYEGIPLEAIRPVFRTCCRQRLQSPTPQTIITLTGTTLDEQIVSAILEAALRLLPADNSPDEKALRQEKMRAKALAAAHAEDAFVELLRGLDPDLRSERQIKQQIKADIEAGVAAERRKLTPDALLSDCIFVCGASCRWVEYKHTFGFCDSPFVARKNREQFKNYATSFGPGIVVYKLGFETGHIKIDGVRCFREADIAKWLRQREECMLE